MKNKIKEKSNFKKFKDEIEEVKNLEYKPKLLLHVCCGPCGAYPIDYISQYFDVTIYYNNSNIYPFEEFKLRYETLENYIKFLNDQNKNVKLVKAEYDNDFFNKILGVYSEEKEGKVRCKICYSLRFKQLVDYAENNNYDYVSTVMTISRHKNELILNELLNSYVSKNSKVKMLFSNFKKESGREKGDKIASELKMYRQNYCGCIFSKK